MTLLDIGLTILGLIIAYLLLCLIFGGEEYPKNYDCDYDDE